MSDDNKSNIENITYDKKYINKIMESNDVLCQHIKDISKEQWENSPFTKGLKDFNKIKKEINFDLLCFSCDYKIHTYDDMKSHANGKHNIFIDLNELTLICF